MVVAASVAVPGAEPSEEALRAGLQGVLSSYKIPRRIVFISAADVPRTATGKIKLSEVARTIAARIGHGAAAAGSHARSARSEEHTSELQSLMRIPSAVFCLQKKQTLQPPTTSYKRQYSN